MTAVETNILVYAHRAEMPGHELARETITRLAESSSPWALPWPCVHEFLAVVTNPRIFLPPTSPAAAMAQVDHWLASPTLVLLSEAGTHWSTLGKLIRDGDVRGAKVHDARIAAICRDHGVDELLTADRDFSRFPSLRTRNPLVRT